mgnify:CR=1 FL=1
MTNNKLKNYPYTSNMNNIEDYIWQIIEVDMERSFDEKNSVNLYFVTGCFVRY